MFSLFSHLYWRSGNERIYFCILYNEFKDAYWNITQTQQSKTKNCPLVKFLRDILLPTISNKISTLINFNGLFASLQVLTKDSVTVSVDAVVYYRVNNATISIANVENAHHSTRLLAQTTLRNTMGTRHLHEILSERMTISGSMQVSGPL